MLYWDWAGCWMFMDWDTGSGRVLTCEGDKVQWRVLKDGEKGKETQVKMCKTCYADQVWAV